MDLSDILRIGDERIAHLKAKLAASEARVKKLEEALRNLILVADYLQPYQSVTVQIFLSSYELAEARQALAAEVKK